MRVLLTTDTIGGVWTYTKELTEGLLDRGHAVALVSFGRSPSPRHLDWCTAISAHHGDRFLYTASDAPLEWMQTNDLAYTGGEQLLLDLAQSFRADLLHTNQFCFGRLPLRIPKLLVAHSDVLSWAAACRPQGLDPTPWLNQYKTLVQAGLNAADCVAAPTHWMLQALIDRFSVPSQTCVIANGRDLPAPTSAPGRRLQAICVGRLWDPAKGLAILSGVHSPLPILAVGELQHGSELTPSLGTQRSSAASTRPASSITSAPPPSTSPFPSTSPSALPLLKPPSAAAAIVARDIPSLREIWGNAALYFQDAHSLSSLLAQLAADPALLADLQLRSTECARHLNRSQHDRALPRSLPPSPRPRLSLPPGRICRR